MLRSRGTRTTVETMPNRPRAEFWRERILRVRIWSLVVAGLILMATRVEARELVISEVTAANRSDYRDDDG